MKILILGAAGQIGRMLTRDILQNTNASLNLYARDATKRLSISDKNRETLFDGDFQNVEQLTKAMQNVDVVYVNDMGNKASTQAIMTAMTNAGVKRIIAASILGIYDEVSGPFGEWNRRMVGGASTARQKESVALIERSKLDYTILRLTWLYNDVDNRQYMLTQKGQPFIGAQVSRYGVSQLILDIIQCPDQRFYHSSLGVSEPNTDFAKPSFY